MSKLKYSEAPEKDSEQFNDFIKDFLDAMTHVPDPGDPDATLASLQTVVIALLNGMREQGMIQ
jgi:hypothetical protein